MSMQEGGSKVGFPNENPRQDVFCRGFFVEKSSFGLPFFCFSPCLGSAPFEESGSFPKIGFACPSGESPRSDLTRTSH